MKTKAKSLKKSPSVIRIAVLENPETKRTVYAGVTKDGRLGKRDAQHLGVKKVATWTEVEAKSWAQATKAVIEPRSDQVQPRWISSHDPLLFCCANSHLRACSVIASSTGCTRAMSVNSRMP